jgi:hypothetical protein
VLYRNPGLIRIPIGKQHSLLYSRVNGRSAIVNTAVARALESARTLRTLQEHATVLGTSQFQIGQLLTEFSSLAAAGLLISETESLHDSFSIPPETCRQITVVGTTAEELLTSFEGEPEQIATNLCREYGDAQFVLADCSASQSLRWTVQAFSTKCGIRLVWAGLAENVAFVDAVCRHSGVPPNVAELALVPSPTYPYPETANYNALLLHSVGDLFLWNRGCLPCHAVSLPTIEGVVLSSDREYQKRGFGLCLGANNDCDHTSIRAAHEQMLGKSVAQCIQQFAAPMPVDTRALDTNDALCLARCSARVRLTSLAVKEDQPFLAARMITPAYRFLPWQLGLDNSTLLPPCLPVPRYMRGAYGTILHRAFPAAWSAVLPYCSKPPRTEGGDVTPVAQADSALCVQTWELLDEAIWSFFDSALSDSDETRLIDAGQRLTEIAETSDHDFRQIIISHWIRLLRRRGTIPASMHPALRNPDQYVGGDLSLCSSHTEMRMPALKKVFLDCGRLLQHWPAMVTAASLLRKEDCRLAQPA